MRRLTLSISILLPLVCLVVPATARAFDPAVECKSAKRPSVDLKTYFETCRSWAANQRAAQGLSVPVGDSVYDKRTTVDNLSFANVPTWSDADILAQFPLTRDKRYMTVSSNPSFQRRISWMFPDDGCFSRAEQLNAQVARAGKARPYKLFAMGELLAQTDNHPAGSVTWGWHVVSVVKNSAGQPIVFDAALSPCKPLPWKTWLLLMVSDLSHFDDLGSGHGVSLGDPNAYTIGSLAQGEPSHEQDSLGDQTSRFLLDEWSRQAQMGRDPNVILGSNPPWSGFACVSTQVEQTMTNVSPATSSTVTVNCPFGTKVVGGGLGLGSANLAVTRNTRSSGNGWQVTARNNSGSSLPLWASAVCLTGTPPNSAISTVTGSTISIGPNSYNSSSATCPTGTLVGGGYVTTAASSVMRVYNSGRTSSTGSTWRVSARNTTSTTKSLTGYAYCLSNTGLTFSQSSANPSGEGTATAYCSSPRKALGGGFVFPSTNNYTVTNMWNFGDDSYSVDLSPTAPSGATNISAFAECLAHP